MPWDPEAELSPAATAPVWSVGVLRPDLASDLGSSLCRAARFHFRRPRCGAASEPREFFRAREVYERVPWAGWGGRDHPPGEPGDLTPHSLPAAEDRENKPWLMMMI